MATPVTVLTYALNGTQKDFTIPFEYLARKFIQVTLIGIDRKPLILNTDYRFSTATTITTTIAWGVGQGYSLIELRRYTSATDRLVDFSDGSILRAYDLNTAQIQSLHIAEEGRDIATDTIGVDNNGNLDARGRKIVNLADAVLGGDAVTLRQEMEWGASALNSANASAVSASASQVSRLASEVARDASIVAKNASEVSNLSSKDWASKAEDSIVSGGLYSSYHYNRKAAAQAVLATSNGAAQVALATTQAGNALTSANAADASRVLAQNWAAGAEDAVVSGGFYSSLHYSRKSAASATAAKTSETNSKTSETNSKTSETNAAGWAAGLNIPTAAGNGGKILAQKSNETGLEYLTLAGLLTDPWAIQPIGVPIPVIFGAPAPPTNSSYRYVALDNDATYNSTFLNTISVAGSDPYVVATAVVNAVGFPLHGATIRLINEERRFLRAGKVTSVEDSALASHNHQLSVRTDSSALSGNYGGINKVQGVVGGGSAGWVDNGTDSVGTTETRGRNMAVRYFMRIK